MRDIKVNYSKIEKIMNFKCKMTIDDGITEIKRLLESGIIENPDSEKYRNSNFIIN